MIDPEATAIGALFLYVVVVYTTVDLFIKDTLRPANLSTVER